VSPRPQRGVYDDSPLWGRGLVFHFSLKMIAFRLTEGFVDLSPDATVSLTVTNAFLDNDYLSRAYTFDISLLASPQNKRLLHHAHRLDSVGQSATLPCTCLIDGIPFTEGVLIVENMDATETYKGYFKNTPHNILKDLEPKLATFAQEKILLYTEGYLDPTDMNMEFQISFVEMIPQQPYTFSVKIRGETFTVTDVIYDGLDEHSLQPKTEELASLIRGAFGNQAARLNIGGYVNLVGFLPSEVVNVLNMNVATDFDTSRYAHKRIVQRVTALINDADSDIVFPVITAPNAYETVVYQGHKAFNHVQQSGKLYQNEWEKEKNGFVNPLVPMVRVRYVLKKIAKRLKLTLGGEWWDNPESQRLILFNAVALDEIIERTVVIDQAGKHQEYLNKWKDSFVIGDHLPDVSARDFLRSLTQQFGLYIEISNGRLLLRRKRDLYNANVRQWSAVLVANSLKADIGLVAPIKLSYAFPDHTSQPLPTEYRPLSITAKNTDSSVDAKDVVLDFNTLLRLEDGKGIETTWGFTPLWNGKTGERPMTLLFYRGLGTAVNGQTRYPYATSDNYLAGLSSSVGDWTLYLTGDKGLYKQHLEEWLPFETALGATVSFRVSVNDLTDFAAQQFCRIFSVTPRGDLHGLVEKINVKIRNNSRVLEAATVTLKRIL
jgi:hypothetical protein